MRSHQLHTCPTCRTPREGYTAQSARDALQLTTGTASPWGTPETLGPMSAIVHRVGSARQWRHAAALADHWSSRIEALGRPECFYPWQWTNLA